MRSTKLTQMLAQYDETLVLHADAWSNDLTGIGTARDKVTATAFAPDGVLPYALLEQLYAQDDVSARICDLLPETALREGFSLDNTDLYDEMEALGVCEHFESAWIFARLYGGAAIIVGMPGSVAGEAPPGGTVTSLLVVDRIALQVHTFYTDVTAPKYGQPETYKLTRPALNTGFGDFSAASTVAAIIHESRVIVFPGARTAPRKKIANQYYDDSVLQRVYSIVQAYGLTWASIVHLLQDAAQGVYSMKDLWNMIVGGNKELIEERMRLVDETRSSSRAILVDADNEDFKRVATPFSGIPELVDRMSERLASAAGYPLTVLFGSSPSGMNATGRSDLELFYGKVAKQQRAVLTPRIQKLARLMHTGNAVKVTYPALWMPSAEEDAKTRYLLAQADNLYKNDFVLTADEIRAARFGAGGWSADTVAEGKAPEPPPMDPGGAPGDPAAPGTAVGTHRFSAKYGR